MAGVVVRGPEPGTSRADWRPKGLCLVERCGPQPRRRRSGLLDAWEWGELDPRGEWEEFLAARTLELADAVALREATYRGLPFGEAEFAKRLESQLGRNLQPKPRGRPPQSGS